MTNTEQETPPNFRPDPDDWQTWPVVTDEPPARPDNDREHSAPDEPTRKRLSLNIRMTEYLEMIELSRWWRTSTTHATIVKAITLCRRIHAAENPDERWPDLAPEHRPRPGYWALHVPQPDGTEDVRRLVIL